MKRLVGEIGVTPAARAIGCSALVVEEICSGGRMKPGTAERIAKNIEERKLGVAA